jgi:hypothetical protein
LFVGFGTITGMRGKLLLLSLLLAISLTGAQAQQEIRKVSPNQAGFTIMPITNGDPSGPPTIDPTVPVNTAAAAVVPEPSSIAMMILGSGCLGALTAFRRRRG